MAAEAQLLESNAANECNLTLIEKLCKDKTSPSIMKDVREKTNNLGSD